MTTFFDYIYEEGTAINTYKCRKCGEKWYTAVDPEQLEKNGLEKCLCCGGNLMLENEEEADKIERTV